MNPSVSTPNDSPVKTKSGRVIKPRDVLDLQECTYISIDIYFTLLLYLYVCIRQGMLNMLVFIYNIFHVLYCNSYFQMDFLDLKVDPQERSQSHSSEDLLTRKLMDGLEGL